MQPGGPQNHIFGPPPTERIQTMQYTDRHAINARLIEMSDELSAGCDPDFDAAQDDLEREFQELRLQLCNLE
jgi:hypothetical protein